jgi:hypothetical protein
MWAVAVILYILGGSFAWDAYRDTIEEAGNTVETLPEKLAFATILLCWPLLELYHLIFERRD